MTSRTLANRTSSSSETAVYCEIIAKCELEKAFLETVFLIP